MAGIPTDPDCDYCIMIAARQTTDGGNRRARVKAKVLHRDNHVCRYCGKYADTVDHVVAVARGGTYAQYNLVACCTNCNARKKSKDLQQSGLRLMSIEQASQVHADASIMKAAMARARSLKRKKEKQERKRAAKAARVA